jgi:hypothetical protein
MAGEPRPAERGGERAREAESRSYNGNVGFFGKIRDWWRGSADPEARAKAAQMREDIETLRVGGLTGQQNVTHRGKDATGR